MKKLFVMLIFMLITLYSYEGYNIPERDFKKYIYDYAKIYNNQKTIKEYQDVCWKIWSTHYRHLNPIILLNIGWKETQYRSWGISGDAAYGTWQLRPANWMHLLWFVDDHYLSKHWNLNLMSFREKARFFHEIKYNFEMMCMVMDWAYKKYKDYEVAVLAYRYGDAPWNYVFKWRRNNMWYWRKDDYYKGVFINLSTYRFLNENFSLSKISAVN